ncbi:MAG: hypothetical protein US11_C0006G0046 [Candidatus Roizmanbacteria bacterium GW2011_GWA2_36_23]|uniref:Uncharacterized protein n=1 Tax=Candidatus Roizmanbacteria bacterium GW2011_GWA2_36_23 TaxID=1618480 RepID=A0A0G0GPA3_9BACT|nr:MAG: hypothetical protein US11_C0006G0046 [Candidatus Roizmanbacteria bacterium GW2011_GWA2_36_23]
MEKQNNHPVSNFWFGYLLGSITVGAGVFFFGTKKGRKTLSKLLELSENLEENIMTLLEELEENIEEKGQIVQAEAKKIERNSPTISYLLDKMKLFSPHHEKKVKKFFVKEGKIIEK